LIALGITLRHAALVLADAQWHGGIVGIVAGRIAETYARPTLIVTLPGEKTQGLHSELAVGSGRWLAG
jgi:single-stranded-DNA-specific exonuclease